MSTRNFSSTAISTTLTSGVTASGTTLAVTATTGFPAAPFILTLEPGTANQEVVLVTAVASLNLTATRGYDSTTGVSHNAGAVVQHSHAAIEFREANTHVNATANVHGVVTPVGVTEAQALTNKTVDLASNTLTGTKAQFNTAISDADMATLTGTETLTSKTLTTPNIATINDGSGNISLELLGGATSAARHISLGTSVVGEAKILPAGTDANISLSLQGKGTGTVYLVENAVASVAVGETYTQTLTNKTLTSPVITTPVVGGSTLTQIQKGNASCVFTASAGPVSQAVTFAQAFSVAPEVVLGPQNNTTLFWATAITTTGFTLNARQYDNTARTITPVCSYIAMV